MPRNDTTVVTPSDTSDATVAAKNVSDAVSRGKEAPATEATIPSAAATVTARFDAAAATMPASDAATALASAAATRVAAPDATVAHGSASTGSPTGGLEKGATVMGLYRVLSNPIEGGMGRVFHVRHTGWNVDLMLKQPLEALFQDDVQKENFIQECDAWINLGLHPHIVTCYYVRLVNNVPAIFGEWMDGGSLTHSIADGALYAGDEKKSRKRILDIAIQAARGLHYAHEQQLVHQDVKPDNILLTADGTVKVADFGIARARALLAESASRTLGDGTIMSENGGYSPAYCSPEQAAGETLTRRTDIWSWAVTVLEMYMGKRLWRHGVAAGAGLARYLGSERIAILPDMQALLQQCFTVDEAGRPHDFAEIEQRVTAIYASETGEAYERLSPKITGQTADFLNNKALSYLDLGNPKEALANWEKALAIDPHNLDAVFNQALYFWRQGLIDDIECLNLVERAGTPQDWKKTHCLGLVQLERKAPKEAQQSLAQATALGGDAASIQAAQEAARKMAAATKPMVKFTSPHQGYVPMKPARVSPDGRHVVTSVGKLITSYASFGLLLFETETGKLLRTLPLKFNGEVHDVLFFKDSRRIAAVGGERETCVEIIDIESSTCLQRLTDPEVTGWQTLSLSGDESTLASSGRCGRVLLWDLKSEKCLLQKSFCGTSEHDLIQLNRDGKEFAITNTSDEDNSLQIWRMAEKEPKLQKSIALGKKTVDCVAVYPDMSAFIFAQAAEGVGKKSFLDHVDSAMYVVDMESGETLRTMRSHSPFTGIVPTRDHAHIYTAHTDKCIRFWDAAAGRCLHTISTGEFGAYMALTPDNYRFFYPPFNENAELRHIPRLDTHADWRLSRIAGLEHRANEEEKFAAHMAAARRHYTALEMAQALDEVKLARSIQGFEQDEDCLKLYTDISRYCRATGIQAVIKSKVIKDSVDAVNRVAISPNGRYALTSYTVDTPKLWDLAAGKYITQADGPLFSNDGRILGGAIALHADNTNHFDCGNIHDGHDAYNYFQIMALHPDGRHMLHQDRVISCRNTSDLESICIHTDGTVERQTVATSQMAAGGMPFITLADYTSKVVLVNLHNNEPERMFTILAPGKSVLIKECHFAPDGGTFLAVYATELDCNYIYFLQELETATGRIAGTYLVSEEEIKMASFSPDGRSVMATSNGKILFWETGSPKITKYIAVPKNRGGGRFSPDGRHIAFMSEKEIEIWNTRELRRDTVLKGHAGTVLDFRFFPDGKSILSCGFEKALILWDIGWKHEFPGWTDWDEGAKPHLLNFLTLHPNWDETDFTHLLRNLQTWGFGYIREEGVRQKLRELGSLPLQKRVWETEIRPTPPTGLNLKTALKASALTMDQAVPEAASGKGKNKSMPPQSGASEANAASRRKKAGRKKGRHFSKTAPAATALVVPLPPQEPPQSRVNALPPPLPPTPSAAETPPTPKRPFWKRLLGIK